MDPKELPYGESLKAGWAAFKERIGYFIGAIILTGLICLPLYIVDIATIVQGYNAVAVVAYILFLLLIMFFSMTWTKMFLMILDKQAVSMKTLFQGNGMYVKYFLSELLYGLIVLGGTILFIIPGIIWSLKYMLAPYLVIDKGMKPMEAIKLSGQMTKGFKWQLTVFTLYLGLFITIPLTGIASAYVYRHIMKASGVKA